MAFGKLHFINVGRGGTFRASGGVHTTPADVDDLVRHLDDSGAGKVVLYFHGGLVDEQAGMAVAAKMHDLFESVAHPIGFVWETGPLETIRGNLDTLHRTELFRKVIEYVLRQVLKRLPGGIGAKGPGEEWSIEEVEAELARDAGLSRFDAQARGAAARLDEVDLEELRDEAELELRLELEGDDEIEALLEDEAPLTPLLDPAVPARPADGAARGPIALAKLAVRLAKIVYRVLKRFVRKRDHGVGPTVVEEVMRELYLADLGAWLWGGMKRQAADMWLSNAGLAGEAQHPGTYLLERLAALAAKRPGLAIDLVGHSAGSIALCHLLRAAAARHPELRFRNLLLLAPACRCDLFAEEIVAHPTRFARFRMFTMRDELETADRLVPHVYTRSLLYLVSGALEDEPDQPLAGLELHVRGAAPYDLPELASVTRFLHAAGEHRLVLADALDAGDGLNTTSHRHGDFDDDPATRASLKAIVAA